VSDRAIGPGGVVVAGGGTAGHLLPGLAVARELVARGVAPDAVHFVGAQRGPEAELVPREGFEVTLLPGRGLQRRPTPANLAAAWGLLRAFATAVGLVRRRRPVVVLALGGYASAAVALAALLWRVPVVVAEQNAAAGAVNRIVGRYAAACCVPFATTDLPRPTVTGNPVRPEVLRVASEGDRTRSRDALGLPADRTVLAVFAGSLGSRRINDAVLEALSGPWRDRGDLLVYHVVGRRDHDELVTRFAGAPGLLEEGRVAHWPVPWEDRMPELLDAADLAVCRAGGTTVAELSVLATPAVLVPLPIATRDHQRANAAELVTVGAAVLVPDAELDAARLVHEVALLADPGRLAAMGAAARSVARPDAAAAVADVLERYARE